MDSRVVALVVAEDGSESLARTIDALRVQSRSVTKTVTIVRERRESLGHAYARAVNEVAAYEDSFLWLLTDSVVPAPDALARLIGGLEVAPSVAIVGPKQMDDERPGYIHEYGIATSRFGRTISLVNDELDQGQHESLSDVLAVGRSGLLVREHVWRTLGGFDPALTEVDDALDFCVRARLAGHRVEVVPAARVRVRVEPESGAYRARARTARISRSALLHRRLTYTRGFGVVWHWLGLIPNALWRTLVLMVGKRPTAVGGELLAALGTFFRPWRSTSARRRLRKIRKAPNRVLDPLILTPAEVRRRDVLEREALRIALHGHAQPLDFVATGGAWVLLALSLVSIVVMFWAFGATALGGGAVLPLAHDPASAWNSMGWGWRSGTLALLGPADPFSAVMGLLATLTWWNPSLSLVLVWILAMPLSGLGAWMLASRFSQRASVRTLVGVGYALAPTLLAGLANGRPSGVIAHVLLPWLAYASLRAVRSWSASAAAALLFAATVAVAPSLWPLLLILWLGSIVLTGRYVARFLMIGVPAVILFIPTALAQVENGTPLAILADPGSIITSSPVDAWQVVLGFPATGLNGWSTFLNFLPGSAHASVIATVLVVVCTALVALLAFAGLFSKTPARSQLAVGIFLISLVCGGLLTHLFVSFAGSLPVSPWPGAALSVAWCALLVAAGFGVVTLGRGGILPVTAALAGVFVLALPSFVGIFHGDAAVKPSNGQTLPAYVVARAETDLQLGTLVLAAQPDGGLSATLVRGYGATENNATTLLTTAVEPGPSAQELARLAANLASLSSNDSAQTLTRDGIGSIILQPTSGPQVGGATVAQTQMRARASVALDANPSLEAVGQTAYGSLWRFSSPDTKSSTALTPWGAQEPLRWMILLIDLIVFGLTLLLAVPTGMPQRDIRPRRDLTGGARND